MQLKIKRVSSKNKDSIKYLKSKINKVKKYKKGKNNILVIGRINTLWIIIGRITIYGRKLIEIVKRKSNL
jgi:hypothetical protein